MDQILSWLKYLQSDQICYYLLQQTNTEVEFPQGGPPLLVDGGGYPSYRSCSQISLKRNTELQEEPSLFPLFIFMLDDLAEELGDSSDGEGMYRIL